MAMNPKLISCGELYNVTERTYKEHYKKILKMAAIPFLFVIALGVFILSLISSPDIAYKLQFHEHISFSLWQLIAIFAGELVLYIVIAAMSSGLVYLIRGDEPDASVNSLFARGFKIFLPMLWVFILTYLITLTGLVLLIIPGIFLTVTLTFSLYAIVADNRRGFKALNASWYYVKGYWWATLGRILFFVLMLVLFELFYIFIALVLSLLLIFLFSLLTFINPIIPMVLIIAMIIIFYYVAFSFFFPVSIIYFYHLYADFKRIKPEPQEEELARRRPFFMALAIIGVFVAAAYFIFLAPKINEYRQKYSYTNLTSSSAHYFPTVATPVSLSNPSLLETKAYVDNEFGFSINPPKGWIAGTDEAHVTFAARGAKAFISIGLVRLSAAAVVVPTETYMESVARQLMKRVDIISDARFSKINNGSEDIYVVDALAKTSPDVLRSQYYYINNLPDVHVISVVATEEDWPKVKDVVLQSVLSFKIQNQK